MCRLNGSTMATTKQTPFDTQQPPQTFSRKQVSHNVRSITKMFPQNNNAGWRKCGRLIVRFVFTSDFFSTETLSALCEGHHQSFTVHPPYPDLSHFPCYRSLFLLLYARSSLTQPGLRLAFPVSDEERNKQTLAVIRVTLFGPPATCKLLARSPQRGCSQFAPRRSLDKPWRGHWKSSRCEQHTWKQSGTFGFKSQKPLEQEQSVCQGARKAFKVLEFSVSSFWLILLNERSRRRSLLSHAK